MILDRIAVRCDAHLCGATINVRYVRQRGTQVVDGRWPEYEGDGDSIEGWILPNVDNGATAKCPAHAAAKGEP